MSTHGPGMARYIRHAACFCALLLVALLVNATRVQVFEAAAHDENPANRREVIARYGLRRGDMPACAMTFDRGVFRQPPQK